MRGGHEGVMRRISGESEGCHEGGEYIEIVEGVTRGVREGSPTNSVNIPRAVRGGVGGGHEGGEYIEIDRGGSGGGVAYL